VLIGLVFEWNYFLFSADAGGTPKCYSKDLSEPLTRSFGRVEKSFTTTAEDDSTSNVRYVTSFLKAASAYVMELCLSDEKALARLKELVEKGVMPVLLYFDGGDTE
jgi:hypothetical protein